jgi:FKBP-type peptidyl-prolyl cis-trans isomerase
MKKTLFLLILAGFAVLQMQAQKTTTPQKSKTTAAVPPATFKNLIDSFSYALGVQVANYYKSQGITNINTALLTKGCNDVLKNAKLALPQKTMDLVSMAVLAPELHTRVKVGDKCIADNKKKPEITTTASGLQYEVLTKGTGPTPALSDTVVCHYKGTFLDGNTFDESYKRGTPAEFALTGVIKGWTEALQLMPVGSKYKLYVPYDLGYGLNDYMGIPGGSLLVFEIELLGIKNK